MSDISTTMNVRTECAVVIIEPAPTKGVQGVLFTVQMSPERARELGHELIDAALKAMRPSCADVKVQRG